MPLPDLSDAISKMFNNSSQFLGAISSMQLQPIYDIMVYTDDYTVPFINAKIIGSNGEKSTVLYTAYPLYTGYFTRINNDIGIPQKITLSIDKNDSELKIKSINVIDRITFSMYSTSLSAWKYKYDVPLTLESVRLDTDNNSHVFTLNYIKQRKYIIQIEVDCSPVFVDKVRTFLKIYGNNSASSTLELNSDIYMGERRINYLSYGTYYFEFDTVDLGKLKSIDISVDNDNQFLLSQIKYIDILPYVHICAEENDGLEKYLGYYAVPGKIVTNEAHLKLTKITEQYSVSITMSASGDALLQVRLGGDKGLSPPYKMWYSVNDKTEPDSILIYSKDLGKIADVIIGMPADCTSKVKISCIQIQNYTDKKRYCAIYSDGFLDKDNNEKLFKVQEDL